MGDGDINSPIMLIGEAPDEKEDLEAKTFCCRKIRFFSSLAFL